MSVSAHSHIEIVRQLLARSSSGGEARLEDQSKNMQRLNTS
jgi:hypothetical protein